jgi:hypothetical protein
MTHDEFLDRVHWSYGEQGGIVETVRFLAWGKEGLANKKGENNMYEDMRTTKDKVGKSYFFNLTTGSYGIAKKILKDKKDYKLDTASEEEKKGLKSAIKANLHAIGRLEVNPLKELKIDNYKISWNKSIDISRGMQQKGVPVIGFFNYKGELLIIMGTFCTECSANDSKWWEGEEWEYKDGTKGTNYMAPYTEIHFNSDGTEKSRRTFKENEPYTPN